MSAFIDAARVVIVYKSSFKKQFNCRNDSLVHDPIGHCRFMYLSLFGTMNV